MALVSWFCFTAFRERKMFEHNCEFGYVDNAQLSSKKFFDMILFTYISLLRAFCK